MAQGTLQKARFEAELSVAGQVAGPAQFELACHPDRDGSLSLSLIIAKPDALKGFALAAFEGPDGIGESQDVAQWSVDTRGDGVQLKGPIGGWYGVDGDGFVLSRSERNGTAGVLHQFVGTLVSAQASRLRFALSAPSGGETLQAQGMLEPPREKLAATVRACLTTTR